MPTLIQIEKLDKSYGDRVLFDSVSVAFSEDQKIGVIGRNGCGKSTLCRMITGEEEPDAGVIRKNSALRLGYIEQKDPWSPGETALNFLMRTTGREEWFCGKTAWKFEIRNEMLSSEIGLLPGGFRTRLKLAAMLIQEPNFLILDEPSNYLDLKTLILLENFLRNFTGGHLIVSHDREFLMRTCGQTLELRSGDANLYPGTVHEYLLFREEETRMAEHFNRTVEIKQKQLETFIDRFKAKASKATQARSKMKQLERLKTIEIDHPLQNIRIMIPSVEPKTGPALRITDLQIGYPQKSIAKHIDLNIDKGKKVAVLGDNGQGKTTFMRTLAGDLEPLSGSYKWSSGCETAWYAQHVFTALDPEMTVHTSLASAASRDVSDQQILNIAGSFLFKGDDVEKKIKVLSGGERSRVCLARLLLSKKSVLLLDEPTNHLDFETVEALGRALHEHKGTVFFISHDRTFVNLIADEIIEVRDGSITHYPGNFEEYVYSMEKKVIEEDEDVPEKEPEEKSSAEPEARVNRYELKKELASNHRKMTAALKKSEENQQRLQKEIKTLHDRMEKDPSLWTLELGETYAKAKDDLIREEENWIKIQSEADALSRKLGEL